MEQTTEKTLQVRIASLDALKALIVATAGGSQLSADAQQQLAEHLRSVATGDRASAVRAHAEGVLASIHTPEDAGVAAMDT